MPTSDQQIAFLTNLQRLLSEGAFVATYKYALLMALADLSVELGQDDDSTLTLTTQQIAEKFAQYYWRQSAPYLPKESSNRILQQNTGRQAGIISIVHTVHNQFEGSLSEARHDQRQWNQMVRKVAEIVRVMPLWKLQTVGSEKLDFLYANTGQGSQISLKPGIAFCFRKHYGMVADMVKGALQVLNDIRVGSWIALGSPEQQEEAIKRMNEQNRPHFIAMDVAGYFEGYFLDTISGELKPGEDPALPSVLGEVIEFPNPELADAEGLVAVGGDLSIKRLLAAYQQGIFPWTVNPITWWSPDPRGIIELDDFHVSESLAKVIRKQPFEITIDKAFQEVMQGCTMPGPKRRGTWITEEFIEAYTGLHKQGHAHSVECRQDGKLVGGVYGVAIGGLFAGESMFHLVDNASKIALHHLVQHLQKQKFLLFDIQMVTAATEPLGAKAISRNEYLKRLSVAVAKNCSF